MSNENYKLLIDKLDSFRLDVDDRLDNMEAKRIPATWRIASVLVLLSAVAIAFLGACAVVIFQ